jgi:hypothetical protein
MKIRYNPSGVDECKGIVELKPVGRGGNPRVGDRDVHRILRQVVGLFQSGRL